MGMITDNIFMPLGVLAACIYIGWFWGPGKLIAHMESGGVAFRLKKAWLWCIRIVTPALILVVTVMGFISVYQVVAG